MAGWMWFWPGETWDHHRLVFEVNRNLNEIFGIVNQPWVGLFGAAAVGLYFVVFGWLTHKLFVWNDFNRKIFQQMTLVQYLTLQTFLLVMWALPVKIILRLVFRIKYVMVTPWFNI